MSFCHHHIMRQSWPFYSDWWSGMLLPNYTCTWSPCETTWMCWLNLLANSSIISEDLPVMHLKLWSFPSQQQHMEGGNRPRQLQPIRRTSGLTTQLWRWHLMLLWLLRRLILLSTVLPLNLCPNLHIEGRRSIWILGTLSWWLQNHNSTFWYYQFLLHPNS